MTVRGLNLACAKCNIPTQPLATLEAEWEQLFMPRQGCAFDAKPAFPYLVAPSPAVVGQPGF